MAALTLVIGNKNYSSWSLRPWLALRAAGLPFEEVLIPLYRPESKAQILRWSPSGKVPALVEGGSVTWDSLAICERAAELAPTAGLWPADAVARAFARSVSAEMHAGFLALRTLCPFNLRIREERPLTQEAEADVARITSLWRECRERFGGGGEFLFGRFGIADAMYAPVVTRFRSWGIPIEDAVVRRYSDAVLAWPHFREWEKAALQETERIASSEP
jgi:glutathione S-transferase